MAKVRNVSGENRFLGAEFGGRLVLAGQTVDVKAEQVYGFTCQSIWEPADEAAKKAHKTAEAPDEAPAVKNDEKAGA